MQCLFDCIADFSVVMKGRCYDARAVRRSSSRIGRCVWENVGGASSSMPFGAR